MWHHKHFYNQFDILLFGAKGDYFFHKKSGSLATDVIENPVSNKSESGQDIVGGVKPRAILIPYIKALTKRSNIVLDLFGGSGSTLIACEQLNRKCFMMEIDSKYCDVIINRWEKFTGKEAKKL